MNDEVVVSKLGTTNFSVLFEKNLYRAKNDPANSTLTSNLKNLDPLFDNINASKRLFDFRITTTGAPGINKGVVTTFTKDLDDNNRNNGLPDLGCYEK